METEKVLVAMSGGVDSSVAAKLLTDAGFSCIGCTMKLYDNEDAGIPKANTCCSLDDVEDARSVAYRLGMPYYVFNLKDKFAECVIDRFVNAYEHGITPNPCIDCNRYLKFDKLFERADIMDCRYIATGHYARIERVGGPRPGLSTPASTTVRTSALSRTAITQRSLKTVPAKRRSRGHSLT